MREALGRVDIFFARSHRPRHNDRGGASRRSASDAAGRHRRRIVECGSGFSTLVLARLLHEC
jgi:hypothetical protein